MSTGLHLTGRGVYYGTGIVLCVDESLQGVVHWALGLVASSDLYTRSGPEVDNLR